MKKIAACAHNVLVKTSFLSTVLILTACALPDKPVRGQAYDFGLLPAAAVSAGAALANAPSVLRSPLNPVVLTDVEAAAALDGTAMVYRLAYINGQTLSPYATSRWSMPPAQLVHQRLRDLLGANRVVMAGAEFSASGGWLVRSELDEFSQVFESATQSSAVIRLRVTVSQPGPQGEKLLGQRSFRVQRATATADAPGGAQAFAVATDALAQELDQWLRQLR